MRIAINTRFLIPGKMEGIGLFTREVSRLLVERRPEDEFLFLFDRPYDASFIFSDQVEAKVVFPPARHPFLWYAWFEWSIPRVLKKWKPDVFLSPDGYASLRSKVPTVMVTHDLAFEHYPEQVPPLVSRYYRSFIPKFHQRADQVVTVSEFTRQDVIKRYGVDPEKVSTACNGVRAPFKGLEEEEKQLVRNQYSDGDPYFFYIGSIHPRKNLSRLISAYSKFRSQTDSQTKLLIAGRFAWQSGAVKQAFENSPYREDIRMLGYLPAKELSQLLGASRALTYVSLLEGFGVPLLEAMWANVPILSSKVSSMPEVCGEAGLLIDPTSVDEIAGGMTRLDKEKELRDSLIKKGQLQRQQFTWNKAVDVVESAIELLA